MGLGVSPLPLELRTFPIWVAWLFLLRTGSRGLFLEAGILVVPVSDFLQLKQAPFWAVGVVPFEYPFIPIACSWGCKALLIGSYWWQQPLFEPFGSFSSPPPPSPALFSPSPDPLLLNTPKSVPNNWGIGVWGWYWCFWSFLLMSRADWLIKCWSSRDCPQERRDQY